MCASLKKGIIPVAKNRRLLDARGISIFFAKDTGFPLSIDSTKANSSRFSSIFSATRNKILDLSETGVVDHLGNAIEAASTAFWTSRSSESGIYEYTSPVAGL